MRHGEWTSPPLRRIDVDKDRSEGMAKEQKGKVKEKAGEWLGDEKTRQEGKADRAEGKVQNAVGSVKDAVKGKK
jgi:uncharacterized protein YjbJ (UPF0337 family)